jgi:hypothetical protein
MRQVCRCWSVRLWTGFVVAILCCIHPGSSCAVEAFAEPVWHTDYGDAIGQAERQGKMLLVFFRAPGKNPRDELFQSKTLTDPAVATRLLGYVCVRLPADATIRSGGRPVKLIDDPAFCGMEKCPGVAILDYASVEAPYYGCVVSTLPFGPDAGHSVQQMSVLLDLPAAMPDTRACQYAAEIRRLKDCECEQNAQAKAGAAADLAWRADYAEAYDAAQRQRKMLLVFFCRPDEKGLGKRFEKEVLSQPAVREKLGQFLLARLPLDARLRSDGQSIEVLKHPAFSEMLGREGLVILDFAHEQCVEYGCVVSVFPFLKDRPYSVEQTLAMFDLPPGSLTQRTLIWAVRTHPDRPASADGRIDNNLVEEAQNHSEHQARIRLQGHHNWNVRFPRINAILPRGLLAREVCAESWPGENLVEAAVECVRCWRLSSGHWSAVRASHDVYGYDMKRGDNGIWYATGIFGGGG